MPPTVRPERKRRVKQLVASLHTLGEGSGETLLDKERFALQTVSRTARNAPVKEEEIVERYNECVLDRGHVLGASD